MPLVLRDDSVLVVVDTQPGFTDHPAMDAAARTTAAHTVERIAWLVRIAGLLEVPILVTEEAPEREGSTHARVKATLPADAPVVAKRTFALTGCPEAMAAIEAGGRRTVVLTGFETDVCVAQSAVTLADAGHRAIVPADAVYTSREDDHRHGIDRMRAGGVEIHSSKSVTFDWLEDVDTADAIIGRASADFDVLPLRL
jgi:nicotinamidase-related amidase